MTIIRTLAAAVTVISITAIIACQPEKSPAVEDPLVAGYRKATIASVADAMDQVTGKRGFLAHDMRPRSPGRIAGRATTVYLEPATAENATPVLSTRLSTKMIDESKPGDVGVIVIKDGLDVAGIGGLMSTAAKAREMSGVIVDGGVRDLAEIRALGLPVYGRSVVASSTVSRFAGVKYNEPVECAGVWIKPGDIIVGDEDGVVAVPAERAKEVLKRSQDIDEYETKMVPFIKKYKALSKAVQLFNRI